MFNIVKKTFAYGAHQVTMETGEIGRQAGGAVMVSIDDTVVLVSVVGNKTAKPGQDFFPLTVDYIEKTYAAGKIPGGFFKREGRPSEKETLTSRLIDRPLRPLFPDGFYHEVQVVATVMSLNPEIDPDIAALIGASAAMTISGIPFDGPIPVMPGVFSIYFYDPVNGTRLEACCQPDQGDAQAVVPACAQNRADALAELRSLHDELAWLARVTSAIPDSVR